jgi:hypothetical protein
MSTSSPDAAIRRIARVQHGVLRLAQARCAGLSDATIRRRVAAKAWLPAGIRVFMS